MLAPEIAYEKQIDFPLNELYGSETGAGLILLEAEKKSPIPPILAKIAFCESSSRQFDKDGNTLRGRWNRYDVGKYQINILYWGKEAERLGYDLFTEEGNEAMALELYRRYGTDPWKWSKACWSKDF